MELSGLENVKTISSNKIQNYPETLRYEVAEGSTNNKGACTRLALGNLTNVLETSKRCQVNYAPIGGDKVQSALTATAVLGPKADKAQSENTTRSRVVQAKCRARISQTTAQIHPKIISISRVESGYGGSDTENLSLCTSTSDLCRSSLSVARGPDCKRARCETSTTGASVTKLLQKSYSATPAIIDDAEIDRRPFKSKLACDIVRAAFADRVQLEELLAECRQSDFAISALDRSPYDRMMEATDYIVGIMAYEQSREVKDCFRVDDFIKSGKQPHLTADMLTTLADWLVEVQELFEFNHETIHLAWGLLYAYFNRGQPLARREIQLMACAAIMVACKHEESKMPPLNEFQYITDGAYQREEFIDTERLLLVAIDFAVHRPNPYVFLRRYARVLDVHSCLVQYMSRFLLEAGMHSHTISLKRDSRKAAAVLWLARVVLRNPSYLDWTRRMDVHQLRQLVRSNLNAKRYYEKCIEASGQSTLPRSPAVCPTSGALDLSTATTTTIANSSLTSRTVSLTSDSQLVRNISDWIGSTAHNQRASLLVKTTSEPSISVGSSTAMSTESSCPFPPGERWHGRSNSPSTILDHSMERDLEAMKSEEDQRSPFWPPILQHITGYKETELIPLAVRYHAIAMRLIAEVARGGRLAQRPPGMDGQSDDDEENENQNPQRCASPGGHHLRRQVVTKYCSDDFFRVADKYPQLAFENFVPHFPAVQCPDSCTCFVCINLVRRIPC